MTAEPGHGATPPWAPGPSCLAEKSMASLSLPRGSRLIIRTMTMSSPRALGLCHSLRLEPSKPPRTTLKYGEAGQASYPSSAIFWVHVTRALVSLCIEFHCGYDDNTCGYSGVHWDGQWCPVGANREEEKATRSLSQKLVPSWEVAMCHAMPFKHKLS